MPQKEKLANQWVKLGEIKAWIAGALYEESNQQVRDALFAASQAISLLMLDLEKVEYEANRAYSQRVKSD